MGGRRHHIPIWEYTLPKAARSFLHIFTVLLNLWQSSKFRINLERTLGQFDR